MQLEVLFFQATEFAKIHHHMNSKDTFMSRQSTEGNVKNLNGTNLTDLIVLQNTSNRQVTAEVVLPHC